MKKVLFLTVIFMMIMCSCATQMEVSIPTNEVTQKPTDIPSPTVSPTLEPTSTPTLTPTPEPTPTPTSIPVYTELGEKFNEYAELLDWEVVVCDSSVVEEDLLHGIFLYREDTGEYFCDFKIGASGWFYTEGSVEYLAVLTLHGMGDNMRPNLRLGIAYPPYYFETPSKYTAEEIYSRLLSFTDDTSDDLSADEISIYEIWSRPYDHLLIVRMWELSDSESQLLSSWEHNTVTWGSR